MYVNFLYIPRNEPAIVNTIIIGGVRGSFMMKRGSFGGTTTDRPKHIPKGRERSPTCHDANIYVEHVGILTSSRGSSCLRIHAAITEHFSWWRWTVSVTNREELQLTKNISWYARGTDEKAAENIIGRGNR